MKKLIIAASIIAPVLANAYTLNINFGYTEVDNYITLNESNRQYMDPTEGYIGVSLYAGTGHIFNNTAPSDLTQEGVVGKGSPWYNQAGLTLFNVDVSTTYYINILTSYVDTQEVNVTSAYSYLSINGVKYDFDERFWQQAISTSGFSIELSGSTSYDIKVIGENNTLAVINAITISDSKIPEPSTYALIGAGLLAGIVAIKRRKK